MQMMQDRDAVRYGMREDHTVLHEVRYRTVVMADTGPRWRM